MSSINIHYARLGEELGWHFDNSSFAVTLMIHPVKNGGELEFVRDVRDADSPDPAEKMGFDLAERILDGDESVKVQSMALAAGDLLLFRGRNTLHRVTPNGDATGVRQLAVLAYNNAPGVSLSEESRMTFYGRTGT